MVLNQGRGPGRLHRAARSRSAARRRGPAVGPGQVAVVDAAVADLAAGVGQRAATELSHAGIRYVLVPESADAGLGARIAAGGGVLPQNTSRGWRVWEVQANAGRLAIAATGDDDWQLPGDPVGVGRDAPPLQIPFSLGSRVLVLTEAPSRRGRPRRSPRRGRPERWAPSERPVSSARSAQVAGCRCRPGTPLASTTLDGMQAFTFADDRGGRRGVPPSGPARRLAPVGTRGAGDRAARGDPGRRPGRRTAAVRAAGAHRGCRLGRAICSGGGARMRLDPRLAAVPVVALGRGCHLGRRRRRTDPARIGGLPVVGHRCSRGQLGVPAGGRRRYRSGGGGALASGASSAGAARIAYADAAAADSADSHLATQPLGAGTSAAPVAALPDHAWVVDGPAAATPMQISVGGPLTDTLSAVQFTRAMVGTVPQASAVQCDGPTTDAWFAGFSSSVGAHATLLLSNVDTAQASVDVSIWGGQGGEPTVRQGIVVAAQTQVVVALDQIDPGLPAAVVHVSATAGRVVPALRADTAERLDSIGRRLAAEDRGAGDYADGAGDSRRRRLAAVGCWRPGRARCDLFTDSRDVGRRFRADRLHLAHSRRWRRVAGQP